MVERAVRTGIDTELARLAPAARLALLLGDPAAVLDRVERLVRDYRRRLDGGRLAAATREDPAEVALRFGLGHVSRLDDMDRWAASGRIG
jgi:hypothetical protein